MNFLPISRTYLATYVHFLFSKTFIRTSKRDFSLARRRILVRTIQIDRATFRLHVILIADIFHYTIAPVDTKQIGNLLLDVTVVRLFRLYGENGGDKYVKMIAFRDIYAMNVGKEKKNSL